MNIKRSTWENFVFMIKNIYKWDRKNIIYFIIIPLITPVITLSYLFFPRVLIDSLVNEKSRNEILYVIALFGITLLIFTCMKEYFEARLDPWMAYIRLSFLSMYYKKCMTMKYEHTEDSKVLDNIEKSFQAAYSMQKGFLGMIRKILSITSSGIVLFVFSFMIFRVNYLLLLILVINSVIIFFTQYRARMKEYQGEVVKNGLNRRLRYLYDVMYDSGYGKDIRIFRMSGLLIKRFIKLSSEYIKFYKAIRKNYIISKCVDSIFLLIREGSSYVILISYVLKNSITIGEFSMYVSLVYQYTSFLSELLTNVAFLISENEIINDFREFIDIDDDKNTEEAIQVDEFENCIELVNVSFQYPNSEKFIIKDLNCKIKEGEKLAIVGVNGAGKTTLIKLICGLYEPTKGRILYKGVDIRSFRKSEYYKILSVVFQDINIMSFSVSENVSLKEDGTYNKEKVLNALKKAGILEKIETLERGIDTSIDKHLDINGVELSGGERQKISLARALYKDGEVVILDEPTAALDPIAESQVYTQFNDMTVNKTAIYISHRLASTKFCDRIILIDDGNISEEGTHDELLTIGGKYNEMFKVQSQYYV